MKHGKSIYTRRVNLGDYEHQELTMEIHFEDGDNAEFETVMLTEKVCGILGCTNPAAKLVEKAQQAIQATKNMKELTKAVNEEVVKDEPKSGTKKKSKSSTSKAKKTSKKSKAAVEEPKAEVKQEVKEADSDSKKDTSVEKPKAEKLAYLKYDREKQEHKKEFYILLNSKYSSWASDPEVNAKAKAASVNLEGEVMYE